MTSTTRNPVDIRAAELDTIAAVLPTERRDELAELLTDQDVATLRISCKHPAKAALLDPDFSVTKLLIDEWRRRAKCDMH